MKKIVVYFLLLTNFAAFTQNWVSAGIPDSFPLSHIDPVCVDTINNKIYVGGIFIGGNSNFTLGIYDGITRKWTTRDTFINSCPVCMAMYNNELYVGGSFQFVNSQYKS